MAWETVMGLEVHVELDTASKIFCSCANDSSADANENVCPACAGMPGLLPVMNRNVVNKAIAAGLVTNCTINRYSTFDKKNYYYPDLSNSYQITQMYHPICTNGWVEIETKAGKKKIRINRIHMEEDAGKLLHDDYAGISMVDYNRCSVPLCEIVSEPDFRSADEVVAYLEKLRSLLRYAGAGRCRMEQGLMRCDVNISVREKGEEKFGVRTEVKNMNSLSAIREVIAYEVERHVDALEWGDEELIQETRGWNPAKKQTFAMREKETAADYLYFPDPDLPPVVVDEEWIEEVRASLPEMPDVKKERYMSELGLKEKEAAQLTASPNLAFLFDELIDAGCDAKDAAAWLLTEALALARKAGVAADDIELDGGKLAYVIKQVAAGKLTRPNAKTVFAAVYENGADPESFIKEQGLDQVADNSETEGVLRQIIAANPKIVADYKGGKVKALDALFGQAMRQLKGAADPRAIREILTGLLNE